MTFFRPTERTGKLEPHQAGHNPTGNKDGICQHWHVHDEKNAGRQRCSDTVGGSPTMWGSANCTTLPCPQRGEPCFCSHEESWTHGHFCLRTVRSATITLHRKPSLCKSHPDDIRFLRWQCFLPTTEMLLLLFPKIAPVPPHTTWIFTPHLVVGLKQKQSSTSYEDSSGSREACSRSRGVKCGCSTT